MAPKILDWDEFVLLDNAAALEADKARPEDEQAMQEEKWKMNFFI